MEEIIYESYRHCEKDRRFGAGGHPEGDTKDVKAQGGHAAGDFYRPGGEIILKKYSPMVELAAFATQYADAMAQTTGLLVAITDRDQVIAVAGGSKRKCCRSRSAGSWSRP